MPVTSFKSKSMLVSGGRVNIISKFKKRHLSHLELVYNIYNTYVPFSFNVMLRFFPYERSHAKKSALTKISFKCADNLLCDR